MPKIVCGTELHLEKCLRLYSEDRDFEAETVTLGHGKGSKDSVDLLPPAVQEEIRKHLGGIRQLYKED